MLTLRRTIPRLENLTLEEIQRFFISLRSNNLAYRDKDSFSVQKFIISIQNNLQPYDANNIIFYISVLIKVINEEGYDKENFDYTLLIK